MPKYILFQTGHSQFALDNERIDHIRPADAVSINPCGSPGFFGIELSEKSFMLIDLAAIAGQSAPVKPGSKAKILLTKGDLCVALWADEVKGSFEARQEQIDPLPPVFSGTASKCFPAVLRLNNQLAFVLDPEALLALKNNPSLGQNMRNPFPGKKQYLVSKAPERTLNPIGTTSSHARPSIDLLKLESIVAHKLNQLIARRIRQRIIKAMARAMEEQRHQLRALLRVEGSTVANRSFG